MVIYNVMFVLSCVIIVILMSLFVVGSLGIVVFLMKLRNVMYEKFVRLKK